MFIICKTYLYIKYTRAPEAVFPTTKLGKSYTPTTDGAGGDGTALS